MSGQRGIRTPESEETGLQDVGKASWETRFPNAAAFDHLATCP